MKATVFIATSLDGFIAREDGGIDWLLALDDEPPEQTDSGRPPTEPEDYGYHAFIATVDALVMGRNSFDMVLGFGTWPYEGTPVIVLTSRLLEIPPALAGKVEAMEGSPREVVARLEERGIGHAYVDGGITIQRFLADGLIDRMIITRIPILLGAGIPLFGRLDHDVPLRHVATRAYPKGLVQSEYEVVGRSRDE